MLPTIVRISNSHIELIKEEQNGLLVCVYDLHN